MKTSNDLSRRNFIKSTAGAGLAFTVVPSHVMGGKGRVAPSDKIVLAHVGCGDVGMNTMRRWLEWDELQYVAACDPNRETYDYPTWGRSQGETCGRPGGREVGKRQIDKFYADKHGRGKYKAATAYEDFRELLVKQTDLDGIFVTTPDHTHATIAIHAMKNGVPVAAHKPIANFFKEVRKTVDVAKKTGVATHSFAYSDSKQFHHIRAIIDKGWIGKVTQVHRWTYRPVWPQGSPFLPEEKPIPDGFNWDLWLGPALPRPYSPEYTHTKFRGWYEFGGGCLCDVGYYGFWPDWRMLNLGMPLVAEANRNYLCEIKEFRSHQIPNELSWPHAAVMKMDVPVLDSDDMVEVYWYEGGMKPPTPKKLQKEGRDLPREAVIYVGEKGSILLHRGIEMLEPDIPKAQLDAIINSDVKTFVERDEIVNAFRGGKDSEGSYLKCQTVAEALALGNIAIRAGRRIEWDNEKMEVTNYPEANAWTDRKYRSGWEL